MGLRGFRVFIFVCAAFFNADIASASCARALGLLKLREALGYVSPEHERVKILANQPSGAIWQFKQIHPTLSPEAILKGENTEELYDFILNILFRSLISFETEPTESLGEIFLEAERVTDLDLFLSWREKRFLKKLYSPDLMKRLEQVPVVVYGEGPDFEYIAGPRSYVISGEVHTTSYLKKRDKYKFKTGRDHQEIEIDGKFFLSLSREVFKFIFGGAPSYVSLTEYSLDKAKKKHQKILKRFVRMEETVHVLDDLKNRSEQSFDEEAHLQRKKTIQEDLKLALKAKLPITLLDKYFLAENPEQLKFFDKISEDLASHYEYILRPDELSAKRTTTEYLLSIGYSLSSIEAALAWHYEIRLPRKIAELLSFLAKDLNESELKLVVSIIDQFISAQSKKAHEPIFEPFRKGNSKLATF